MQHLHLQKAVRSCRAEDERALHTLHATSTAPSSMAHAFHSAETEPEVLTAAGICAVVIIPIQIHTSFQFLLPSQTSPSEHCAMMVEGRGYFECIVNKVMLLCSFSFLADEQPWEIYV